ncbi:TPA_asm: hypothetical protein PROPHIFVLQ01-1_38 [Mycobacterium phage prophiFVLQ01-1]|nr:TPA_asm: hypothetical protein PROPHIFVLQ01-1_38 [Mycobacterium phage prophiFVLQ01-1]
MILRKCLDCFSVSASETVALQQSERFATGDCFKFSHRENLEYRSRNSRGNNRFADGPETVDETFRGVLGRSRVCLGWPRFGVQIKHWAMNYQPACDWPPEPQQRSREVLGCLTQ